MAAIAGAALVSGCEFDVLDPAGRVGVAEKTLITTSTLAMLLVVVPVIVLTLFFAFRYRASGGTGAYRPKWAHSNGIEVVIWAVPALIVTFLAVLTWSSTHDLDPYRPIASTTKPIEVQVVALDWKWLFIYPDLGIASVNQLAVPVGTPVAFHITSDTVMNSFFIPQLGSQVYAMSGMETRLHLVADRPGNFAGMAANFSGPGFSDMVFRAIATPQDQFDAWVQKVRASHNRLTAASYATLTAPSEKTPVEYFSSVDDAMFQSILGKYHPGKRLGLASASDMRE